MKAKEKRELSEALHRELRRAEDTELEMRGLLSLVGGYIRWQPESDCAADREEADTVHFLIEMFCARLQRESTALYHAATNVRNALVPPAPLPPEALPAGSQQPNVTGRKVPPAAPQ